MASLDELRADLLRRLAKFLPMEESSAAATSSLSTTSSTAPVPQPATPEEAPAELVIAVPELSMPAPAKCSTECQVGEQTTKPSASSLFSAIQVVSAGAPHADAVLGERLGSTNGLCDAALHEHVSGSEEVLTQVGGLSLFLESDQDLSIASVSQVLPGDQPWPPWKCHALYIEVNMPQNAFHSGPNDMSSSYLVMDKCLPWSRNGFSPGLGACRGHLFPLVCTQPFGNFMVDVSVHPAVALDPYNFQWFSILVQLQLHVFYCGFKGIQVNEHQQAHLCWLFKLTSYRTGHEVSVRPSTALLAKPGNDANMQFTAALILFSRNENATGVRASIFLRSLMQVITWWLRFHWTPRTWIITWVTACYLLFAEQLEFPKRNGPVCVCNEYMASECLFVQKKAYSRSDIHLVPWPRRNFQGVRCTSLALMYWRQIRMVLKCTRWKPGIVLVGEHVQIPWDPGGWQHRGVMASQNFRLGDTEQAKIMLQVLHYCFSPRLEIGVTNKSRAVHDNYKQGDPSDMRILVASFNMMITRVGEASGRTWLRQGPWCNGASSHLRPPAPAIAWGQAMILGGGIVTPGTVAR